MLLPPVEWRTIPGFPSYEASNGGLVRSVNRSHERLHPTTGVATRFTRRGIILSQIYRHGYMVVNLSEGGKTKRMSVHQLVARAWHGNPCAGMVVNHINGNKLDNRPSNLEYVTNRENVLHAYKTALVDNAGEKNGRAKLSDEDVNQIRLMKGQKSGAAVGRMFGVTRTHIHRLWKNLSRAT